MNKFQGLFVFLEAKGVVLEPTGAVLETTGAVLEPAGVVLETTGSVLEPAGRRPEAPNRGITQLTVE